MEAARPAPPAWWVGHEDGWWFAAKQMLVWQELCREIGDHQDLSLLDAGCGSGWALPMLGHFGRAVGVDPAPEAVDLARRQGMARIGTMESLPFPSHSFDVVTCLDVIEHVSDDHAALESIARCLKPGGRLLLTVPSNPALWSKHDEALGHHRRYTRQALRGALANAGLTVNRLTGFISLLYLGAWLARKLGRGADTAEAEQRGPLEAPLLAATGLEVWLLQYLSIPWGLSWLAWAHKP